MCFFSCITKNLNWEICWYEVKDEKFEYFGGSLKNSILWKGVFTKKQYIEVNCLERGAWQKERRWYFFLEGGWYPNAHYDGACNLNKWSTLKFLIVFDFK